MDWRGGGGENCGGGAAAAAECDREKRGAEEEKDNAGGEVCESGSCWVGDAEDRKEGVDCPMQMSLAATEGSGEGWRRRVTHWLPRPPRAAILLREEGMARGKEVGREKVERARGARARKASERAGPARVFPASAMGDEGKGGGAKVRESERRLRGRGPLGGQNGGISAPSFAQGGKRHVNVLSL